jgi:hypothetical protein
MGNEIVYCRNCQTRLLSSDFERGAAFKIEGIASCDKCSADVLQLLPPDKIQGYLHQIARSKKGPSLPEKAAPDPDIVPPVPKTRRAAERRKGLGVAGWSGLAAGAAGLLILVYLAGRDATPEPPAESPRKAAPATGADLADLEKRLKEAAEKHDFGGALAALDGARARHGTPEWTGFIERKSKELRDAAFRSSTALKEKAVEARRKGAEEEVKRLREQVALMGLPELLADVDRALKQVPGPNKGPRARFVRIENSNPVLHMAEVQVFSGGENVALKGSASQSSTYAGGEASHAIDGNTDGRWESRSVTHTEAKEETSWWEVDLGRTVPVDKVVLWNRTDGDLETRMKGYVVRLLDEARKSVDFQKSDGYPDPTTEHVFAPPPGK